MIVNPAIHSIHTHTALKSQFPFIWISKLNEQQQMNDVKVDPLCFKAFLPLRGWEDIEGGGRGFSQVAEQRGVIFPVWHIYTIRAVNPPLTLVEHDGLWILVHHLGHVTQNVLLGDDAQETPAEEGCKQRSEVVAHVMSKGRMCRLEETNWNCNQISLTATLITQINQLQEKVESKTQLPLLLLFLAETAKHGHCGLDHKVSWPLNTSWPLI